jgi:aspartate--ammonia ligase
METTAIEKKYKSVLDIRTTEQAIQQTKDFFADKLSEKLQLSRVSAPMVVLKGTGINDDLNGYERAVAFPIKDMQEQKAEVVHSLAKWKRLRLQELGIEEGKGLYTNMYALRPDEDLSPIHSIFVDQWDWEKHIYIAQRSIPFLQETVEKIYEAIKATEAKLHELYPSLSPVLPEKITFIQAEDLLKQYPKLSPKERENEAAKKHGAVFIIGIGGVLKGGEPHDGRAPDYDDWTTETEPGYKGLNGDIILWNPVLKRAFEVSSMGIRVDKIALLKQLEIAGCLDRKELFFHSKLLKGEIPQSIGGGIGQSRLCMFLLKKAHIGEVQVSIWPDALREECIEKGIELL